MDGLHVFEHGRVRGRRLRGGTAGTVLVGLWLIAAATTPSAQPTPLHLNPAIEKLAQGKPIIGTNTSDLSLENARSLARSDFDYVYVDMEHSPLNMAGLHNFLIGMIDKSAILKKGNAQPNVAVFARFPPYGRDHAEWIAKQALDMGLMGVIFNGIDNKEQALLAVQNMRYPQKRGSKYPMPAGIRGTAPGYATWVWGISGAEYYERADVWPLNPQGDLLAIPMIETLEGLDHVNEIASVPGVGAIFIGAGADLSQYLGVAQNSPEVEKARQTILHACVVHKMVCAITASSKADVEKRIKEGWRMIRTGRGE